MNDKLHFQNEINGALTKHKPIYLQFGFGNRPFVGFFNIDIHDLRKQKDNNEGIFIIDDWVKAPLPIPDNSVDFIFHQDFFEHLEQRDQVLFLAETLRVLKPGCYHRINVPDLLYSMSTWSKFNLGYAGVYDEWSIWKHKSLPSKKSLEELALLVGYKEVNFNGKNQSISKIKFIETRPGKDRPEGNIFADLRK